MIFDNWVPNRKHLWWIKSHWKKHFWRDFILLCLFFGFLTLKTMFQMTIPVMTNSDNVVTNAKPVSYYLVRLRTPSYCSYVCVFHLCTHWRFHSDLFNKQLQQTKYNNKLRSVPLLLKSEHFWWLDSANKSDKLLYYQKNGANNGVTSDVNNN